MRRTVPVVAVLTAMLTACKQPAARMNAPPHGGAESVHDMQGTFVYMSDNALLSDMSVSDRHFLPHRPILSTLGEQHLGRLASLMKSYGGTLRFSSDDRDEKLGEQRIAAVRARLAELGVDTTKETVTSGLPGGSGMDAAQAVLIKANLGTYVPPKKSQGSGIDLGALTGGGDPDKTNK